MVFARLGISGGDLPLVASDALAIAWTHASPSPLDESISKALGKKRSSTRKKKATTKQWMDLIEKMGGHV
jgi:crossover junction endodeoxyribonuclease RuvC